MKFIVLTVHIEALGATLLVKDDDDASLERRYRVYLKTLGMLEPAYFGYGASISDALRTAHSQLYTVASVIHDHLTLADNL